MNRQSMLNKRTFNALLGGLVVGVLSMGLVVSVAWAAPGYQPLAQSGDNPTPQPGAEGTPGATIEPKDCAACHPDVNDAWVASPHAHAYDDEVFLQRWKSLGETGECLVCHTTGYQATSGEFTAQGVTCEACHGEAVEGHPPAVVPVRADTEYCGTCHTTTLGEWRLTGHASANVGCTDCHNPHSQQALFENPDEMCVNCHKDDIGEHKDDLHIQKGITCVECHALVIPSDNPPPDGLVPTGHTFTITPATCVSCHTDTLRIGNPLPGYEAGARAVAAGQTMTSTLPLVIAAYTGGGEAAQGLAPEQQIQALEAALASARLSTLFQGGIIGLVLGGTTAYLLGRNQRRETEIEATDTDKDAGPASGTGEDTGHA
jgi:predicted CXXCH cytochrome family protein